MNERCSAFKSRKVVAEYFNQLIILTPTSEWRVLDNETLKTNFSKKSSIDRIVR